MLVRLYILNGLNAVLLNVLYLSKKKSITDDAKAGINAAENQIFHHKNKLSFKIY